MPELTDRQKEILNAAIDIISEAGIQGFSIRALAGRVGVTEPAIYRHFENKDQIMLQAIAYIGRHWQKLLRGLVVPDKPALEELEIIYRGVVQNIAANWPMTVTLYSSGIYINDKQIIKEIFDLMELGTHLSDDILRRGQRDGSIRRDVGSRQLAEILVGTLRNLIERWNLSGQPFDLGHAWEQTWGGLRTMLASPVADRAARA